MPDQEKDYGRDCYNFVHADLEYMMIDSTIRAHTCAAGYQNQDEQGLGQSKGGLTSKIHAKVDALDNPLQIIVTPGQHNDTTQAESLLQGPSNVLVITDKGYSSKHLRTRIIEQDCDPVIPSEIKQQEPWEYDKHIYKERPLIECFFSKLSILDVFCSI